MDDPIHRNLSTRNALRMAHDLGCTVMHRSGTDELVIRHDLRSTRPLSIKGTRKDSPRALLSFLRHVRRMLMERGCQVPWAT